MKKPIIFLALVIISVAFTISNKEIEFNYPKSKDASFLINTDKFKKFTKEWRGEDYYYLCENGKDGLVCSVLFYKLNEEEKLMYVDMARAMLGNESPEISPVYPQTYFTTYSNLAKFESNKVKWGEPTNDFMYSQADVKEFQGIKINQKHMYGYAMFKDLFVNIHLSKVNCTPADSIAMRDILNG